MSDSNQLKRLRQEVNSDLRDKYEEEELTGFSKRPRKDSESDDELPAKAPKLEPAPKQMSVAEKLLAGMGYKEGKGLGKHGQGIVEPIKESTQRGRTGLGHDTGKALARDNSEFWDESAEDKTVKEEPTWIECDPDSMQKVMDGVLDNAWMVVGKRKEEIEDENTFVDGDQLKAMLAAKDVFDSLPEREMNEARARSNPYETIGSAFFQNRAAMKTANIDAVFGFLFSQESKPDAMRAKNPMDLTAEAINVDRNAEIFYFADVCAGPGGFSEYMLWRKKFYNAKGFGFTLIGNNDFNLGKFKATSANYFEAFYGANHDGDVTSPENIDSLEEHIAKGTLGRGVHLMMADGGFCVDGKENIQEILSKRIYLCQLLISLCIVREGGNFFCKLFDLFTPFSVGLVYLMYACYEKISIHKPHTSRPANSERYIICKGLRAEPAKLVKEYLKRVNRRLDELELRKQHDLGKEREREKNNRKRGQSQSWNGNQARPPKKEEVQHEDVNELVPFEVMDNDAAFMEYIMKSNNMLVVRQKVYLDKIKSFAKNQNQIDRDQGKLREECMEYWQIPNLPKPGRNEPKKINANEIFDKYTSRRKKPLFFTDSDFNIRSGFLDSKTHLNLTDKMFQHEEYECSFLSEKEPVFILCTGDAIFKRCFSTRGWEAIGDIKYYRLPPDTIVLADLTKSYGFNANKQVDRANSRDVIRILDAAVIHGDDISELPYTERMKAVEKMCQATERVSEPLTEQRGRDRDVFFPCLNVAATRFSLKELCDDSGIRAKMNLTNQRGDQTLTFTEHGRAIFVKAVRGTCYVNADSNWHLYWSRSAKQLYAGTNTRKETYFRPEWIKNSVFSTFWQTAIHKKGPARNVFIWKWEQNYDNGYGPRPILDDENCSGGVTLKYLSNKIAAFEREAMGGNHK